MSATHHTAIAATYGDASNTRKCEDETTNPKIKASQRMEFFSKRILNFLNGAVLIFVVES